MSAMADLSCAELTLGYRRGALSPVEVARDVLARIERYAALNAFLPMEPEAVLAAARSSEARWRAGRPPAGRHRRRAGLDQGQYLGQGPADAARLQNDRQDQRCRAGTGRFAGGGAAARAGRRHPRQTALPEHGWIGVCHSPLTGITRNPWNSEHTPGGSTGGGAVAALLGLGVLHLGTDGAGSLRIPAAFTGVFGMKPSFGRVPIYPAQLLNVLSHQGPITRMVADAALMLSVIAQPDARDMAAWNTPAPDFTAGLDQGVRGLRVAFSPRLGQVAALDPEIEAAARQAARALEEQGALVEKADPPLERALDLIRAMWWPVATAIVDAMPEARRADMDPGFRRIAERGRHGRRLSRRLCRTRRAAQFHAAFPRALRPAADADHAGHALKVGREMPQLGAIGDDWLNWSPYTFPFNLTQQPAASVPCGLARNGLRADRRCFSGGPDGACGRPK